MRYFEETAIKVDELGQCCGHWVEVEKYDRVCIYTSFQSVYTDVPTARPRYVCGNRLGRLIVNIGIDNRADIRLFVGWWETNGAAVQRSYANYRWCGGNKITFADWARDAFLCWLEPMSEDDVAIGEEYNDNYPQEWWVMGDDRAARVTMRWREQDEKEEDFFPLRLEYMAGDYPTFRQFDNFEDLNTEVIKWTGR